ncbi:hypothetical protein C8F01DRAFT_1148316 [Mycena amicta]|nr:hypothetical protein C8F01DRAFT_1148316 [Mycena amicta]
MITTFFHPWILILPLSLGHVSAVTTLEFTPLENPTSTVTILPTKTQTSTPFACIDACFNNATGGGTQGGCPGLAGQYACICVFPAMMQSFASCLSTTCSLDNSTVQETLGNVQQVCASCTPDGCNTFSISGSGDIGITQTIQAPISSTTASLCPTTVQSMVASSGLGGVGASGFISVGLGPCSVSSDTSGNSAAFTSGSSVGTVTGGALSDSLASPTTNSTGSSSASDRIPPHKMTLGALLALVVGGTLV